MNVSYGKTRRHRGISLVVVISMLGLLILLAVSLLTMVTLSRQTNNLEAESRKSEMLAKAAFNTVLADLTDEMKNGAASVTENKLDNGKTLRRYDFTNKPAGMLVSRALKSTATFANTVLVKQSASGVPFHTFGGNASKRASEEATAAGPDPLDPSIWTKPLLLAPGVELSAATAPDWVYIDREGGNPKVYSAELKQKLTAGATNPKFVIGRYAYNMYDTSGLIDINAAGHPATQPGAERVVSNGSLVMADLAGLPGMTAAAVTNLTSWKHDWAASTSSTTTTISPEEDYLRLSEGSGWQVLAANDNLFLSRQDMLRFAKLRSDSLPAAALHSFTHFSRDLDAPAWRPHPKRPKVARNGETGGNDAFGQDQILNPDLASFDKPRQRQLLPRRFPLERLQWVATPGANGPLDEAKAEKYFGLRWKDNHWEYVHGRSDGRMYTLQDVPSTREANFFEILRATVLVGSLGRQFAAVGYDGLDQALSMYQLPKAGGIGGVDAAINLNIMELGACIIDQYDSDSNPSAITVIGGTRPYTVYGKEDVPYINRLSAIPYRGKKLDGITVYNQYKDGDPIPLDKRRLATTVADSECYQGSMVLQPMLWRPHQIVKNYDGPTKFRIRPRHIDQAGGSVFYMVSGWPLPGQGVAPGWPDRATAGDYSFWGGPNYRTTNPELFPKTFRGDEYLDVTVPADSTAFREPQSVSSTAHGAIAGYTVGGNVPPVPVRDGDLRWNGLPTSYTTVSGFLVGYALTARVETTGFNADQDATPSSWSRLGVGFFRGDPIEVQMEYQAPDGKWRPYQVAEFSYKSNWGDHFVRPGTDWNTEAFHWSSYVIDPRTARFGSLACVIQGGLHSNTWGLHPLMVWPEGAALAYGAQRNLGVRPGWTVPAPNTGWNYNAIPSYWEPFNPGTIVENNKTAWDEAATYSFAYLDPDGVMRPGIAAINEYASTYFGNPMSRRCTLSDTGRLTVTATSLIGRPRVLNRPFRAVAELAYSFRGTPWRDIDFLNPSSPDAGLLDVFSLYENPDAKLADDPQPPIVAGRVNLNSASEDVIAALLRGTAIDEDSYVNAALAKQLATVVHTWLHSSTAGQGPLSSMGALVSTSVPDEKAKGLIYELSDKLTSSVDRSINDRREFAARALSGGTTVQAWNFLLDLVVQSGQLPPSATSMKQFQSAAERRFWVHFAIDRPTGRLLDVQWEPVTE